MTMMSGAHLLGDSARCLVVARQRRHSDLGELLTRELDSPWGRAASKPACHRGSSTVRNTPYYSISSPLCVARRISYVGALVRVFLYIVNLRGRSWSRRVREGVHALRHGTTQGLL